jgi:hypothetical protein
MLNPFRNSLEKMVRMTIEHIYSDTENKFNKQLRLIDEIETLKQKLETLRIEKARKDEEYNMREREVTHKLGLERIRQEQDAVNYKKEIELEIREGNLITSEKQFKDQMEFQRKQLQDQIIGLQSLVEKVFEKIPEVRHETKTIKRITGSENEH